MQVIYFPYLGLKQILEIEFKELGAKVWNFDKKGEEYIPDAVLRARVKALLDTNMRHKRTIADIGVLSVGDVDFNQAATASTFQVANEIRLILFLSFIAARNTSDRGYNAGHYMVTSENFIYVVQNFDLADDHISERNGFIVPISIGGYKVGEYKFTAPTYILDPIQFKLDGELFTQLRRLKAVKPRVYKRIMRAADLLFESYFNDPNLSVNGRILLAMSAFEVLLNLPDKDQRKTFKELVANYADAPFDKPITFYSERRGGKKAKERGSRKVVWADQFYTLRNHIIHGDTLTEADYYFAKKQRHIDIALIFFVFMVKQQINKSLRKKIFFDEIKWRKTEDEDLKFEGFTYDANEMQKLIHEALQELRKRR